MRVYMQQTAAQIKLRVNLLCEKCKTLTHSQSRHSAFTLAQICRVYYTFDSSSCRDNSVTLLF